jgi:hypothetical protein
MLDSIYMVHQSSSNVCDPLLIGSRFNMCLVACEAMPKVFFLKPGLPHFR